LSRMNLRSQLKRESVRPQMRTMPHSLPWFNQRQAEQLDAYERINPSIARLLREQNALYLFGTLGMEAILQSDGTVLVSLEDSGDAAASAPPWRVATERERRAAFVIGRKRIPEVEPLLPDRAAGAVDCKVCRGTGLMVQDIVCMDCGGMGWVEPVA
jgi:hypothetical protein